MTLAADGEDTADANRIKDLSGRIRTVGAPTEHLLELRKKEHSPLKEASMIKGKLGVTCWQTHTNLGKVLLAV